jgi:hypothetical protein
VPGATGRVRFIGRSVSLNALSGSSIGAITETQTAALSRKKISAQRSRATATHLTLPRTLPPQTLDVNPKSCLFWLRQLFSPIRLRGDKHLLISDPATHPTTYSHRAFATLPRMAIQTSRLAMAAFTCLRSAAATRDHSHEVERQLLGPRRLGYLGPELSQVMIKVEVGMSHALGLGHFP